GVGTRRGAAPGARPLRARVLVLRQRRRDAPAGCVGHGSGRPVGAGGAAPLPREGHLPPPRPAPGPDTERPAYPEGAWLRSQDTAGGARGRASRKSPGASDEGSPAGVPCGRGGPAAPPATTGAASAVSAPPTP